MAAGVSVDSIRNTVSSFKAVEHRIEFVTDISGVKYLNDSKATSVDATIKAVEALAESEGKTVLILGGRGKNAPYAPLIPLIDSSVRAIVVIGEDAENIENQLHGTTEIVRVESLDEAVWAAREKAVEGDAVLLAPARASFDMFKSFEERGTVLKSAVRALSDVIYEGTTRTRDIGKPMLYRTSGLEKRLRFHDHFQVNMTAQLTAVKVLIHPLVERDKKVLAVFCKSSDLALFIPGIILCKVPIPCF